MTRSIFNLKVSYRPEDGLCVFLLWDDHHRDMSATQLYSDKLERDYQFWRSQYLKFYNLRSLTSNKKSGSIPTVLSGDRSQDVRTAEQQLLNTFLSWLGEGEVHTLEQRIRDTLMQQMHEGVTDTDSTNNTLYSYIDIYLNCDEKLEKLPWEAWITALVPEQIPHEAIRLIRTCETTSRVKSNSPIRTGKSRFLAILAEDSSVSANDDWDILKTLKPAIILERVEILATYNAEQAAKKLCDAITDSRGWDVLYFAGHSDDTAINGGTFALSPTIKLSIRDIKDYLEKARQKGLQLAIFNSCCGLSIGNSLTQSGIQCVVMREPIHNEFAIYLLGKICKNLRNNQYINTAVSLACQKSKLEEKVKFPSSFLIPSFFSPPNKEIFHIRKFGWKNRLKQGLLTKKEMTALCIISSLSILVPFQNLLFEWRTLNQSIFRDITHQRITLSLFSEKKENPSVTVIVVDRRSILEENIDDFDIDRIDRGYLSKILENLSGSKPNVIGINYVLDFKEEGEKSAKLEDSIDKLTQQDSKLITFVGYKERNSLSSRFATESSLEGYGNFSLWEMELAEEPTCPVDEKILECPFSYLLAIGSILKKNGKDLKREKCLPEIDNYHSCFQKRLNIFLKQENLSSEFKRVKEQSTSFLGWESILDISLPPDEVYKLFPAQRITNIGSNIDVLNSLIHTDIVIVGAAEYRSENSFDAMPWAISYWHNKEKNTQSTPDNQSSGNPLHKSHESFSTSEAQAYMVHQLLLNHRITKVPSILLVSLAALLGKGLQILIAYLPKDRQRNLKIILVIGIAVSGVITLQIYISGLYIPWLLPSIILFYMAFFKNSIESSI